MIYAKDSQDSSPTGQAQRDSERSVAVDTGGDPGCKRHGRVATSTDERASMEDKAIIRDGLVNNQNVS